MLRSCVCVLCCLALTLLTAAMQSGFGRRKEPVPAIKSDIKFIKCEACKLVAKEAHQAAANLRRQQPSWRRVTEEEILNHLESLCAPQQDQGDWITKLDVQVDGEVLRIVQMQGVCSRALLCPSCTLLGTMVAWQTSPLTTPAAWLFDVYIFT
jgi:hypothetical protein